MFQKGANLAAMLAISRYNDPVLADNDLVSAISMQFSTPIPR